MVSEGLKDNILDERCSKDFLEEEKLNTIVQGEEDGMRTQQDGRID